MTYIVFFLFVQQTFNQLKTLYLFAGLIVFKKIRGSLKNIVRSKNIETRLKKWRSGIEAVISNLKRGFELFRYDWKTRARFDAKVYWNVIVYNIRVMTRALIVKMQTQIQ